MILDLCLVTASFFIGYFFINRTDVLYNLSTYIILLPVILLIWALFLYFFELDKSFRVKAAAEIVANLLKAGFFGLLFYGSFSYAFKIEGVSRALIITVFILSTSFIAVEKLILLLIFRKIRSKGYNYRRLLIAGTGTRARKLISLINGHKEWGLKIIGIVDEDRDKKGSFIEGYEVIGTFEAISKIAHEEVLDEVIFVVPRSQLARIEDAMCFCELEGIKVSVAVDIFELKFSKAKQTDIQGFPLLTFESTSDRLWALLVKRVFDIIFSFICLLVLSPLFLIVSILIKGTSKGPVFFRQVRSTLKGRKFILYKFRTMVQDAEEKLEELKKHNQMNGPVFKMDNDPRLTKIGRVLRKTSIDELPQLWNVFKGDMSIVGPRPPIPEEVSQYDYWHRRRLSMRPGITCLWQINGRNKIVDFDEWVKLDLKYIDTWSLWLDIKILIKTFPVVLFGVGAK